MNKAGNTNREVATVENASKGPEYMRKDSIFINDGTPGGTVKFESQVVGNSNYELSKITNTYNGNTVVKATNKVTGEIYSFKNFSNAQTGNSLSITNTNTSLVPLNPNVSTGVTVTTSSSARTVTGSVVPNLITSGKSVTTLEAPKNPVVKPVTKIEQETVPIINGFTSKQIKEMSLEDLRKIGSSETTSSNAIKKLKGTKEEALKFFESRVVGEIETKVNPAGKVIKVGFDKFGNKLTYRDFSVINGSYPTIELFKGSTGSWVTKFKFE